MSLAPGPAHALEAHLAGSTTCPPLYASPVATRAALARDPAGQDPITVIRTDHAARVDALLGTH